MSVFLLLLILSEVLLPNLTCASRVRRETTKVRISAIGDTIMLKFLQADMDIKLEGYILGYGKDLFSKQFLQLPEDGEPYETEIDAEPKYLVVVQPVKGDKVKKECAEKQPLEKPLHLVIGSVTPTSVMLSWGTLLNTLSSETNLDDCIEDSHYTVRYREQEPRKKWSYQTCPTTVTVIDQLKADTPYEFGVRAVSDNITGVWSSPVIHNTADRDIHKPVVPENILKTIKPVTESPQAFSVPDVPDVAPVSSASFLLDTDLPLKPEMLPRPMKLNTESPKASSPSLSVLYTVTPAYLHAPPALPPIPRVIQDIPKPLKPEIVIQTEASSTEVPQDFSSSVQVPQSENILMPDKPITESPQVFSPSVPIVHNVPHSRPASLPRHTEPPPIPRVTLGAGGDDIRSSSPSEGSFFLTQTLTSTHTPVKNATTSIIQTHPSTTSSLSMTPQQPLHAVQSQLPAHKPLFNMPNTKTNTTKVISSTVKAQLKSPLKKGTQVKNLTQPQPESSTIKFKISTSTFQMRATQFQQQAVKYPRKTDRPKPRSPRPNAIIRMQAQANKTKGQLKVTPKPVITQAHPLSSQTPSIATQPLIAQTQPTTTQSQPQPLIAQTQPTTTQSQPQPLIGQTQPTTTQSQPQPLIAQTRPTTTKSQPKPLNKQPQPNTNKSETQPQSIKIQPQPTTLKPLTTQPQPGTNKSQPQPQSIIKQDQPITTQSQRQSKPLTTQPQTTTSQSQLRTQKSENSVDIHRQGTPKTQPTTMQSDSHTIQPKPIRTQSNLIHHTTVKPKWTTAQSKPRRKPQKPRKQPQTFKTQSSTGKYQPNYRPSQQPVTKRNRESVTKPKLSHEPKTFKGLRTTELQKQSDLYPTSSTLNDSNTSTWQNGKTELALTSKPKRPSEISNTQNLPWREEKPVNKTPPVSKKAPSQSLDGHLTKPVLVSGATNRNQGQDASSTTTSPPKVTKRPSPASVPNPIKSPPTNSSAYYGQLWDKQHKWPRKPESNEIEKQNEVDKDEMEDKVDFDPKVEPVVPDMKPSPAPPVTELYQKTTTTPFFAINGSRYNTGDNSSIFSSVPVSEVDTMGKKRFVAPHVVYQIDKPPEKPCSVTNALSHFPDEENGVTSVSGPPKTAPTNLTVVTVEGCPSFVIIDWDGTDNETTAYDVTSSVKSKNGKVVSVVTTNQTHTAVENLKPESSYEFTVTPKNELGSGPSSEPVSFNTESADPRVSKVPTGKNAIWSSFSFKADGYSECTGTQYVKRTWYRKFVGIQLCNSLRYKIYLSDSLKGKFYNIGDETGYGEDHCQFVDSYLDGRTGGLLPPYQLPLKQGYFRAMRQEPVRFGKIGGRTQINYVAWYECGVPIPGSW